MSTPHAFVARPDIADHVPDLRHLRRRDRGGLMAHADELLAAPPEILAADVRASK